jgi:acyl-CoA hydrolase
MTVSVEMIRENLASGQRDVVTRGNFEMIAVNEHGRSVAIAQTLLATLSIN